ncbi:MAG: hypothetical protein P1P64_03470 [Treponemataceae bacterium]
MKFNVRESLGEDVGIVLTAHPPIFQSLLIKAGVGKLKAGTILKAGDTGYEAASDADTPSVVLVEDIEAKGTDEIVGRCLLHGCVAQARLLDASKKAAPTALCEKLVACGIYPLQSFDD